MDSEPVAWLLTHPTEADSGTFDTLRLTDADKAAGWTETPLYTRPTPTEAVLCSHCMYPTPHTVCGCDALAALQADAAPDGLVAELLDDAKHGYGAASDWSDAECAEYWSRRCLKARRNASKAAARITADAAKIAEQAATIARLEDKLTQAIDRINDMLEGDDGQAWKEARKFVAALSRDGEAG